jgi:hypothetical protein
MSVLTSKFISSCNSFTISLAELGSNNTSSSFCLILQQQLHVISLFAPAMSVKTGASTTSLVSVSAILTFGNIDQPLVRAIVLPAIRLRYLTFILPEWVFQFLHMVYEKQEYYLNSKR